MIRSAVVALLAVVLFPAIGLPAPSDLEKARKLLLGGKYAEAADFYRPMAANRPEAAIGLARCLESQGKSDEAVRVLQAVTAQRPEIQSELARLAFQLGDFKEAQARADRALQLAPEDLLAGWIGAELARAAGQLDEAQRGYRRLVRYYNDHDVQRAESLRWIGLAAAQYSRWNRLSDQFDFLVNELYPDALKQDAAYWPAYYESGVLFLEKCNHAEAFRQFNKALELNPNAAEVHAALAAARLADREIDRAEASLRRALEINPRLPEAWVLRADLAWANLQVAECLDLLDKKARPLNPRCERTLGRIAACYLVLDGAPKGAAAAGASRFERLVADVTGRNAHAGEFFCTLAEMLEARNKQAEAESYFHKAIEVSPRQIGPHAGLGMLYMRTGQEAEARRLLDEAFKADPFHVRVKNTLDVLDVLDTMKTVTTRHFTIRFDADDSLLVRYAARRLETIYPELCKEFGYEPPGRTLVEIFSHARGIDGHQWFSARMVGLPYLGTVAASTGRIVAMTSPSEVGPNLNWARVLRHELVHVITLQQTHFNIPHWYTEGLAVRAEGGPRPQRWGELLRRRVAKGRLLTLQTINLGFSRPMAGDDCQLAYCQAELYVRYMLSRGGPDVLRRMLTAYAENPSTPAAIRQVFGAAELDFERGYVAYVKGIASSPAAEARKPDRDHRSESEEAAAWKTQAQAALARRDYPSAANWANQAMETDVKDAEVHRLLAAALVGSRRFDQAIEEFETAVELEPAHLQQRFSLADAYVQAGQTAQARRTLEALLKRAPNYPGAEVLLESLKKSP